MYFFYSFEAVVHGTRHNFESVNKKPTWKIEIADTEIMGASRLFDIFIETEELRGLISSL